MNELQEELAKDPEDFSHERWTVDDPSKANWALRKLRVADERLEEIRSQAKSEFDRIVEWAERVSKEPQQDKVFFTSQLSAYMLSIRTDEVKSLVLPDGEIHSRAVPAKAQVADKELLLKWALNNERGAWIRTKEEPDMDAIKGGIELVGDTVVDSVTGEVVEGMVVVEADVSVSVTPSK